MSTPPPQSGDTAALVRIEVKLDQALTQGSDHEVRLRALERARWPLPTLATLTGAGGLVTALTTYFQR